VARGTCGNPKPRLNGGPAVLRGAGFEVAGRSEFGARGGGGAFRAHFSCLDLRKDWSSVDSRRDLPGHERQRRREAAGRKGRIAVPGSELFGRAAERGHEQRIGLEKSSTGRLGDRVYEGSAGAGQRLGKVAGIPGQDRRAPQDPNPPVP
jgi:hypothetical protein